MAGNPAISTRIEHRSRSKAKGQRRHDMREGPQPKYVTPNRTSENSVLVEPTKESALAKICEERASHLGRQRARKSNAAIATTGIVTFSKAAQPIVNELPRAEQDRLLLDSAQALAEEMGTTLHGAVVHRDETALHMHYRLAAVRTDGRPVSKVADTAALQDVAAATWSHLGIERGTPKQVRKVLGEPASSWTHRSVKQLHEDLPGEIEEAKRVATEQIADAMARVATAETRASEAEKRATQTAERLATAQAKVKEANGECRRLEKRAETYQRRLETQQGKLTKAQTELEEAREEIKQLQDEIKALANADQQPPRRRQISVPQTEQRGRGPFRRPVVTGEKRLTYIKPSDTQAWHGAALKRAEDARKEADRRRKEAEAAHRQRREEAEQRQRLQNALIQTMTAPAPCGDAEAALWAAEAVQVERYGVQMQVAANIARVPPQEGLSDRQIAAALYREGREQGWERQWFSVSMGIAREIIALAREDGRLDHITFRDNSDGAANDLLREAIEARDEDPMAEPPSKPSDRDEMGL
jgi:uncharacterized coiled-coil DUF342 family protein